MATITQRTRADGSSAYTVQIRITRDGIRHTEAQTFSRHQAAKAWATAREAELAKPGALSRATTKGGTLADAIDRYTRDSAKAFGKTKAQVLASVKRYDIAALECHRITSADIVAFAQQLIAEGRQPQTAGNYISHLATIFSIAEAAWNIPLRRSEMDQAAIVMRRLGLTGRSNERMRRPTVAELDRIMERLARAEAARPGGIPMTRIIPFALYSTRRQAEITRIEWRDLDERNSRVLVRDMKNPGDKIGNHVWCDLPPEALAIVQAMPRAGERIFPYNEQSVSAAFARTCTSLEIADLTFHDLRHEGISRLFEMGATIPKAAAVSGHRSWKSLQRYTHLREDGDRWAGWRWREPAVTPAVR